MSKSAETGELTSIRAEIVHSVIKKSVPKDKHITIGQIHEGILNWLDENLDKLIRSEPWLAGRSLSFLYSKGWLKRHIPQIEIAAARDGYAFLAQPFKGCMLTRRTKKIAESIGERQKHTSSKIERHNYLNETFNANPRYQNLQFAMFSEKLLPPPQNQ